MDIRRKIFGVVMLFATVILLIVMIESLSDDYAFGKCGRIIQGIITSKSFEEMGGPFGPSDYFLSYQYTPVETGAIYKNKVEAVWLTEQTYKKIQIGEPITIEYLTSYPAKSRIYGLVGAKKGAVFSTGTEVNLLLAIGAALLAYVYLRTPQNKYVLFDRLYFPETQKTLSLFSKELFWIKILFLAVLGLLLLALRLFIYQTIYT